MLFVLWHMPDIGSDYLLAAHVHRRNAAFGLFGIPLVTPINDPDRDLFKPCFPLCAFGVAITLGFKLFG